MSTRSEAFLILKTILLDQEYSNLSLRERLKHIDEQHRPFVTQVVYGTLENFMLVRYAWETYVEKLPRKDVCVLLDMSVYQLLCMEHKADYAIVNEMVEICKHHISKGSANLVNAVLRKVIKQGMPPLPSDPKEALSIETSHPLWLIHMWTAQYGEEVCTRICKENLLPRKSSARVNTLKISREELLAQDENFRVSEVSADGVIYQQGSIASTTWFQEGYIAIQDEASQLVAQLLDPQPNERILDVCSAPGTKACHIAQKMQNEGYILCGDIHEHRVELIRSGAERLGITCMEARVMDALELQGVEEASFDRVLCDVPCSGYGTLSRKSDIKVFMQSNDMDTLIPIQAGILRKSAQMVKPDGILVYSTCTLNKKENEKQVAAFLKEHPNFTLLEERTIFPFTYACDGFYMAKMKRAESK